MVVGSSIALKIEPGKGLVSIFGRGEGLAASGLLQSTVQGCRRRSAPARSLAPLSTVPSPRAPFQRLSQQWRGWGRPLRAGSVGEPARPLQGHRGAARRTAPAQWLRLGTISGGVQPPTAADGSVGGCSLLTGANPDP